MSHSPIVAYFSAEYAIADDLPIYAGGLGVLAADLVLEAAAQNREFYGVGLVYHEAFAGNDADQRSMVARLESNGFKLVKGADGAPLVVTFPVADRTVAVQAWRKTWGKTKLVLLDARRPENDPADQAISGHLYPQSPLIQMAQEMCLGFGGVAMLTAMNVRPNVYHLNEGHAAQAGLALVLRELAARPEAGFEAAVAAVKPQIVGTKHTILSGAGMLLDWDNTGVLLGPVLRAHGATLEEFKPLAFKDDQDYSSTRLLVSMARQLNGVSELHVKLEHRNHPSTQLIAVTNGVYRDRWLAPNWGRQSTELGDAKIWALHRENKQRLLAHVHAQTGGNLDPERLTVVWARRMTAYKRPELLVSDLGRLAELVRHPERPIQFIVAGSANPSDRGGIDLMNRVIEASQSPELAPYFAYLPRYNPVSAKLLVQGADLWLNTPIRGYEACGTSGMKASLNGAVQYSTSDGWVDEVALELIGWPVSDDDPSKMLYDRLEHEIAPLFYDRDATGIPVAWVGGMRANMKLIQDQFTATRMLNDYYAKLYAPSLA